MQQKKEIFNKVSEEEFSKEVLAMVRVCFEGKAEIQDNAIELILPSNEKFLLTIEKAG